MIEEECTGNGTLAAARAGVLADAVILPEPTGLEHAARRRRDPVARRRARRASPRTPSRPTEPSTPSTSRSRSSKRSAGLEREMNAEIEPSMRRRRAPVQHQRRHVRRRRLALERAGEATLRLRVGHPTSWSTDEAMLAGPPRDRRDRRPVAPRPSPDDPAVGVPRQGVRAARRRSARGARWPTAHRSAHGDDRRRRSRWRARPTRGSTSTTSTCPRSATAPSAHDIHGIDESVELSSIVAGARTLARFIADWYAGRRVVMSTVPTLSILEPVKLRSGGEHVADRLVTAIALGEFVPGQRLPVRARARLDAGGQPHDDPRGDPAARRARVRRGPPRPHRRRLRARGDGTGRDRDDPADAAAGVARTSRACSTSGS